MTLFKRGAALLLCVAIASCGGGGGSPGVNPNAGGSGGTGGTGGTGTDGGTGTPTTSEPKVSSFIHELSNSALTTSGGDKSLLTVTALDEKNNPVAGATVTVSVDSGVYTPVKSVTDASGQASGNITIGANKANRNITATIAVGGQSARAVIPVTGSQVSLTPVPANPAPEQPVQLGIRVVDASGTGVANVPLVISGALSATATTDSTGAATVTLAAPKTTGSYSVVASALGVQTSRTLQVVTAGGGGIPDAVGAISSASLSIDPNTIRPNAAGSKTYRAGLKAKFLNASNQAIQNVRVRFDIDPPALGGDEEISTGTATVYSDSNGEAVADYIAGTRSSPTNGVRIRACYGMTDASIAGTLCPASVTQTLTVASQPVSVTLGDNNLLSRGNNSLTYIKQFDVAVSDAAGNAVPNATISASVDVVRYGKGDFADPRTWCLNEDTNRNGALDLGEDRNNNGILEPRQADVILSFLGSRVTGANGRLAIQVEYPQNVATWLDYRVRVTTSVSGSEGTVSRSYITGFIEGDEKNGSFLTAPYGAGACTDAN